MATRRMFSLQIADADAFLDLKQGPQNLYFHLGLRADDDGFVSGPKRVARSIGCTAEDYQALVDARFIIDFDSGVCVIKHWHVNNSIRKDRYTPTQYVKEKKELHIDADTGKYQLLSKHPELVGVPDGNRLATKEQPKSNQPAPKPTPKKVVKKARPKKAKPTIDVTNKSPEEVQMEKDIAEVINLFDVHNVNASASKWYGQKVQREACRLLLKKFGLPLVSKVIALLPKTNTLPAYECPSVTTPNQLLEKWHLLEAKLSAKKMIASKPKAV